MVEKGSDKNITELRKLLKGKGAIIGTERTLKNLKLNKISKIYMSSNCADTTKSAIEHYSKENKVNVINLRYPNDELGVLCKKTFSISVLSVKK
ncbi:MAG: ribosomal L7Ae/L30e/S12e/Gadd45 family protein [Nanoarchaeota archaeon]|nr:ribosomal L7Ae/L30e/S12e/Gadd45 family protein [Nanoarchaeota archaeon]